MNLFAELSYLRVLRRGVKRAILGQDGVLMHLVPPRYCAFKRSPFALVLNGRQFLSVGQPHAILLGCFMDEAARLEGKLMSGGDIENIIRLCVMNAKGSRRDASEIELASELEEILASIFDAASGGNLKKPLEPLSIAEYPHFLNAPFGIDLHVDACGEPGLDTAQWKRIIRRCEKAGIVRLTFAGGKSSLRPDLPELVEYARRFASSLDTDGAPLTPKMCEALKFAGLGDVKITLYSHVPDIHDRLSGAKNTWENSVHGIQSALAAGLDLRVLTPLGAANMDYDKTLVFLKDLGVQSVLCSGGEGTGDAPAVTGENSLSLNVRLTEEMLSGILASAAVYCKVNDMKLCFLSADLVDVQLLSRLGLETPLCGDFPFKMALSPDGSVFPGREWFSERPFGNLLNDRWRKIWNGKLCKAMRL